MANAVQLERARWIRHARSVLGVVAVLFALPGLVLPIFGADAGMFSLVMSWTAAAVVMASSGGADRSISATVRADEGGLWIDGACVVPRSPAMLVEVVRHHPPIVLVRGRRLSLGVRVQTDTEAEARALVAALGGDPLAGFRRFVLPSWRWGSPFMTYALYTGAFAIVTVLWSLAAYELGRASTLAGVLLLALLFVVMAAPAVLAYLARVVATIGRDGVSLATRLGSEWLPWSAIAEVRPMATRKAVSPAVDIELRDGRTVRLYTMPERTKSSNGSDPVLAALLEARTTAAGGSDARPVRLARGERTVREWIDALRSAKALERGYREMPLTIADLLALVVDARATEEDRAAAGVALAASPERDVRDKLRVALDDVAAPRVRVALKASLDADDASLTAALDDVSRAEPR